MIQGNGTDSFVGPRALPETINAAYLKVLAQVETIKKGENNEFGGYAFTSVDQIYGFLVNKLAEAQLTILPYELTPTKIQAVETKNGLKQWGHFHIGFLLQVGKDAYSDPHISETLFIQLEGAQTFHGAKSYCQKTFLRSWFKLPTGEPDLDALKTEKDDENKAAAKPKKDKAPKFSDPDSERAKNDVLKAIATLFKKPPAPEDRDAFLERWNPTIDSLADAHKTEVRDAWKRTADASKVKACT